MYVCMYAYMYAMYCLFVMYFMYLMYCMYSNKVPSAVNVTVVLIGYLAICMSHCDFQAFCR